ncbi:hypothetical protein Sango_2300600 [Sesamum angolense]|uniref:Pentatricopeptide repeat-containing protein n=1 Tax=Sesamum angolense TaxID=2727404 RepID=A0AAE1WAA6_9LAMI|nr:hypothetical protein Sango_2300600 [Sesamum angolense]
MLSYFPFFNSLKKMRASTMALIGSGFAANRRVINWLCKAGHTLTAYDLLGLFEETSFNPGVKTYSTVIDSLCKDRMVDALQLLAKMIDKGISPYIVTYNRWFKMDTAWLAELIKLENYLTPCQVEEAWCLFLEVPHKGLDYNVVTYNTMLHGLFRAGRFAEGLKLFKDMQAQQVIPDLVTYTTLLNGLCINKQIVDAFRYCT